MNWYRVDSYTAANGGLWFYVEAATIAEAVIRATSGCGGDPIVRVKAEQVDGPPVEQVDGPPAEQVDGPPAEQVDGPPGEDEEDFDPYPTYEEKVEHLERREGLGL